MTFARKYFDPLSAGGTMIGEHGTVKFAAGERPQDTYLYKPRIVLAVNVALATDRPLLVSGEPGSGKTLLAQNVAAALGWWWYKQTVTSRATASDLLWTFDALGRLNDANVSRKNLYPKHEYVEPGRLWWAFDPSTATNRGLKLIAEPARRAKEPGDQPETTAGRQSHDDKAVILLDEIDKADPDVPNDLLEPLDIKQFTVKETDDTITRKRRVLLMMTTNGERELPPAFMRRCISLTLDPPTKDWFVEVADTKYGAEGHALHDAVAAEVIRLRKAAKAEGLREPSTAEFLDALEACRQLGIDTASTEWQDVAAGVLWKHGTDPTSDNESAPDR